MNFIGTVLTFCIPTIASVIAPLMKEIIKKRIKSKKQKYFTLTAKNGLEIEIPLPKSYDIDEISAILERINQSNETGGSNSAK